MTYSAEVLTDSPLAYWRLGEASGESCLDSSSGGTADGYYTNTPTLAASGLLTGDANTAVTFASASSEYVVVYTSVPVGTSAGMAIEAWVSPGTMTSSTAYVIARWYVSSGTTDNRLDYWEAGASSTFRYLWWDGTSTQTTTSAAYDMATGSTYHVVVSHDFSAETVTFYVNGSILGSAHDVSAYGPGTILGASANATIARGGSDYWNGTLDEIAFYGSTLSSTRVGVHYTAGTAADAAPTWTTPADAVSMSTTPELKFNSPDSAASQHFYLELDTANTFNTANLRQYDSSVTQTNWAYWDGDSWEAVPVGGMSSAFAGNEIRYTVTSALTTTTWYRRVRAGTLA